MPDGVHRTYRSPALLGLGAVGLGLVLVLAIWVLADELGRGHLLVGAATFLWGVVLVELVFEAFVRPSVSTTPEGVVLVNPFRTVFVPWEEVRGVDTDLALQIVVDGGRHTSWAATGNRGASARARGGLPGRRAPAQPGYGAVRPSLAEQLRAGSAAGTITPPLECKLFIDAGMTEWRERTARTGTRTLEQEWAELNRPDGEPPAQITWHRPVIVAVAVPAVLLVVVTLAT